MEDFGSDNNKCGEWNFISNSVLDCKTYIHVNNPNARPVILNYMDEENLLDAWRIMNENVKKFSWCRLNPERKQARLDFFLVSDNMFQFVMETDIVPSYRTDHGGIILTLKLSENERGK